MKFCPNCNNYIDDNATYCNYCGVQFVAPQQEQQQYYQGYAEQQQYQDYSQQQYQDYDQQQYQQHQYQPQQMVQQPKKKKWVIIPAAMVAVVILVIAGIFLMKPKASEGLEFASNGDGTCKWVGLGTCTDTEVIVPEKNGEEMVVAIAEHTMDFTVETVTKVVLPETIKSIDINAFDRVRCLETVVLNEGLETIGEDAFRGCESLQAVEFPSTLKSIGEWAFAGCVLITEVNLPEGLTELGKFAFSECNAVKKITIPSTLNKLHFIAAGGGNCGYEFDTTSVEEVVFNDNWKYTTVQMDVDDNGEIFYYGILARDISEEKYPGTFAEVTDKNRQSVICALFNKESLKVNDKTYTFTKEKPSGKYEIQGFIGFVVQEFVDDGKLNVSYRGTSERTSVEDLVCNEYKYDEENKVYTFQGTATHEGSSVALEKAFVNFGDFLFSLDYTNVDGVEDIKIRKWMPYSEVIANFVEEDVEKIEEEKIEDLVEKKENLLADLIAAFAAAGIKVSVDEVTGELAMDASVLFGGDSAELTAEGKAFLNTFISVYTSIVFSEKYDGFVSKTMVEGHTALLQGSTYESGLPLSEQRANAVKTYCLSSETGVDTSKLSSAMEAVGLSNSKPIYTASGEVDKAASRRVSFRFILNIGV